MQVTERVQIVGDGLEDMEVEHGGHQAPMDEVVGARIL